MASQGFVAPMQPTHLLLRNPMVDELRIENSRLSQLVLLVNQNSPQESRFKLVGRNQSRQIMHQIIMLLRQLGELVELFGSLAQFNNARTG